VWGLTCFVRFSHKKTDIPSGTQRGQNQNTGLNSKSCISLHPFLDRRQQPAEPCKLTFGLSGVRHPLHWSLHLKFYQAVAVELGTKYRHHWQRRYDDFFEESTRLSPTEAYEQLLTQ
jgi:hypothetical protein